MPRIAALLDISQVSDIIKVISNDTFLRPIYAGNAFATVKSNDKRNVLRSDQRHLSQLKHLVVLQK